MEIHFRKTGRSQLDDVGGQRRLIITGAGLLAGRVERCWPRTWEARRSETSCFAFTFSMQARRQAGLRSFPCSLGQDQIVQGVVGHKPSEPHVLRLQRLEPLHLVRLHAPVRRSLTIGGLLRDADRPRRFRNRLALRRQHLKLPRLGDDLLRLAVLSDPPRAAAFNVGGSLRGGQTKKAVGAQSP